MEGGFRSSRSLGCSVCSAPDRANVWNEIRDSGRRLLMHGTCCLVVCGLGCIQVGVHEQRRIQVEISSHVALDLNLNSSLDLRS